MKRPDPGLLRLGLAFGIWWVLEEDVAREDVGGGRHVFLVPLLEDMGLRQVLTAWWIW